MIFLFFVSDTEVCTNTSMDHYCCKTLTIIIAKKKEERKDELGFTGTTKPISCEYQIPLNPQKVETEIMKC